MRPAPLVLLVAAGIATAVFPLAAEEAIEQMPVLVAIDASRSLSGADAAATAETAGGFLRRLPSGAPVGVLSFDDEVRWLARPGDGTAAGAPARVRPTGRFTLLHDALVEGVRELRSGGVIVLFTDGRDEGSATTLEDAARLAGERQVRVVSVGTGRADERTLRRIALLTGGTYAGPQRTVDADRLAALVTPLREALAAERRAAAARLAPPPTPVPTPTAAPAPPPPSGPGTAFLGLAFLLCIAAAAIGYLLARRRLAANAAAGRGEYPDLGTSPGIAMPPAPSTLSEPAQPPIDPILLASLRARAVAPPGQILEVSLDDTASFRRLPFSESAEKTLVLTEETVLTIREPGRDPRSFRLPPDRAISVGRDSQRNTLAFHDPTLSSQHCRIVLDEGVPYLIDLGSTNGVFVNEMRLPTARLRPGDRLRAGMLELELQVRQQSIG